jgi:hypothetical protein
VTVVRTGVPAGNFFPVGDTFVSYRATDRSGNFSTATQKVTVLDNTQPVVTAPPAKTLFTGAGATSCGVTVTDLDTTLSAGSATDNCPGVGAVIRSGVPSGNFFPVGTTTLVYSATDAYGNSASATQVVTVVDNTAPAITCPPDITLEPTCPTGAIATWTEPVGTDNCPGTTTTQTAGLVNGSVFPVGTTTVTYMARDASGNTASCSFSVTVLTVTATIEKLKTTISGSSLNAPQSQGLLPKLNSALDALAKGNTNQACQHLNVFINSVQGFVDSGDIPADLGAAWIQTAQHLRNALGCTNNPCM